MVKIKIENIKKTFNPRSRNKNQVLKGVSFDLPEKGLVAIFGKSGSGKTTLLNIIGGLERQDGGRIYIDGENVAGKVDKIRNAKIGFIFQNYYLERGCTISEIMRNAMLIAGFDDEAEIKRRSEEVLKIVDMGRYKNKQGDALSGGQKQRVAIARALIKGADIILADEPTGNLDAQNTVKVMEILKEISKTRLVVLVTHEITLIKNYADKVTSDGKKLALDIRCFDCFLKDEHCGKLDMCADNAAKVYAETTASRGTQLIFCDLSTPKKPYESYEYGKEFDAYNDLKHKLIERGVPQNEIAFIHDAKTDKDKQLLFDKMNEGRIRILIGSTEKCGAGTNVQRRLAALHHLDAPYRPRDLQQRDGRGIRQGNDNKTVKIFTYVTKRTLDSYQSMFHSVRQCDAPTAC